MCPSSLKFKNYKFTAYYFNLRPLPDTCQLSSLTQYLTCQADKKIKSVHLLNYLITYRECVTAVYCIISIIINKTKKCLCKPSYSIAVIPHHSDHIYFQRHILSNISLYKIWTQHKHI